MQVNFHLKILSFSVLHSLMFTGLKMWLKIMFDEGMGRGIRDREHGGGVWEHGDGVRSMGMGLGEGSTSPYAKKTQKLPKTRLSWRLEDSYPPTPPSCKAVYAMQYVLFSLTAVKQRQCYCLWETQFPARPQEMPCLIHLLNVVTRTCATWSSNLRLLRHQAQVRYDLDLFCVF